MEDDHVGAQLGEQGSCQRTFDAGDFLEQSMLGCVGFELLVDAGIGLSNVAVGLVESSKLQSQNEAMMFLDRPFESGSKLNGGAPRA